MNPNDMIISLDRQYLQIQIYSHRFCIFSTKAECYVFLWLVFKIWGNYTFEQKISAYLQRNVIIAFTWRQWVKMDETLAWNVQYHGRFHVSCLIVLVNKNASWGGAEKTARNRRKRRGEMKDKEMERKYDIKKKDNMRGQEMRSIFM